MKDYCSLQFRRFSFFIWIIGSVVFVRDVECYSEVLVPEYRVPCVPGQEGWMDSVLQWMPEELKNPDSICVNRLGTGSHLCREEYNGNYSSICAGMWCRDPILQTCTQLSTNDGVQCGDKKWCSGGVCRYSEQATVTAESCPFGDSSTFSSGGLTCQEMVSREQKLCYDDTTEQNCCQSCQAVRRSRQGCQYGDWIDGCQQENCPQMTENQLGICCQTCGYYIIIVPPEQPPTTPVTPSSPRTTPAQKTTTVQRNATGQQQTPSTSVETRSTTQTPGSTSQGGATTTTRNVPQHQTSSSQTTQSQSFRTTQSQTSQTTSTEPPTGTSNVPEVTSSQQPTGTKSSTVTTNVPVVTSSQQPTRGPTSQAPDSSSQGQTTVNNIGVADTQQGNANAVTIGTGVGVGVAVVVIIIVVVVYVIKKRVVTSQLPQNNAEGDTHSVGGNSHSDLTASMTASSTTWYPDYRATHTMSPE